MRRGGSRGKKVMKFIAKANSWLRKSKVLSNLGSKYGKSNLPYANAVGKAAGYAGQMGYGRRRRGLGLSRAGSGLRRAGAGRRCRNGRRCR